MSKRNTPFVPPIPHVDPPSQEALEQLQNMTKKERRQLDKSLSQNKHVQSVRNQRKQHKREQRKKWWQDNWIAFLGLIFAFLAAIPVISQGIESILKLIG